MSLQQIESFRMKLLWGFYSIAPDLGGLDVINKYLASAKSTRLENLNRLVNMKPNETDQGRLTNKGQGVGTITQEMVMQRASEIAVINGRSANEIIQSDVAQARRELAGHTGLDLERPRSERVPEDQRWDPLPESQGKEAPTVSPSDEQTFEEKLVQEGVDDAEHDQMLRATRESLKREPPE